MNGGQAFTLSKLILQDEVMVQRTERLHFECCDLALIPSAERQGEEAPGTLWPASLA